MTGYPKWFNKNFITITVVLLFVSGILLIPNTLNHKFELEVPFELSGNLRLITTATHILAMCVGLFILGGVSAIHAKIGLKKKQNAITGISLYLFFILLVLTGLGILYGSGEILISASSAIHIVAGVLLLVIYLFHKKFR